ncbi:hypothetical protein GCM10027589_04580 [Actinocorallia lasiicapitis]
MSQTKPDPDTKYDATGTGRSGDAASTSSNWDPHGLLKNGRALGQA